MICKKYLLFTLLSLSYVCSLKATQPQKPSPAREETTFFNKPSFTKEVASHPILFVGSPSLLMLTALAFYPPLMGSLGQNVLALPPWWLGIFYIAISVFVGFMFAFWSSRWKHDAHFPSLQKQLWRSFRFLSPGTMVSCCWYILYVVGAIFSYEEDKKNKNCDFKVVFTALCYPFIINVVMGLCINVYVYVSSHNRANGQSGRGNQASKKGKEAQEKG